QNVRLELPAAHHATLHRARNRRGGPPAARPLSASRIRKRRVMRSPCRQRRIPMNAQRPPLPPFTLESAAEKVRLAEDGWNSRDPGKVALAYTVNSNWRNRAEFLQGREAIIAFLTRKWQRELDYRLIKELWAFRENRIA